MDKTKKNIIPFVVAIVLGIISVITVNRYITDKTVAPETKNVRIMIAKATINPDKEIALDDLGTKIIPLSVVSEVNIQLPLRETEEGSKEINSKKAIVAGRISTRLIPAGDPVFWSDFRKPQVTRLANKIPSNLRAVTIPVDSLSSVGYNIVPGDHVDILATSKMGCGDISSALTMSPAALRTLSNASQKNVKKEKIEPTTYVVMQDVLVLAVSQDFNTYTTLQNRKMTYSNITLEVSMDEALMLTHAKSQVSLSCILRSPASINRIPTKKLFSVNCTSLKGEYIAKFDKERAERIEKQTKQDKSEEKEMQPEKQVDVKKKSPKPKKLQKETTK